MMILAIFGKVFDLWQLMLQGTVRALAIQTKAAFQIFIGYWMINLPMSIVLCFYLDFGYSGLWYSIMAAQIYLSLGLTWQIEKTDWQGVADESLKKQKEELEHL